MRSVVPERRGIQVTDVSYSIKKTDVKQGIGLLAAEGVKPPIIRCFLKCQKDECLIKHGQFTFLYH